MVTGGGAVYRSNMSSSDGAPVFPIGTKPASYTPAVVASQGAKIPCGALPSNEGRSLRSTSTLSVSYLRNRPVGYNSLDAQNTTSFLFYRLKVIMTDGSFFYSPTRVVKGKYSNAEINVWPNPVRNGGVIHIYYGDALHVKALSLIDVRGRRILYQQFPQPLSGRNHNELHIPANLAAGIYFLQFLEEDNQLLHMEKTDVDKLTGVD